MKIEIGENGELKYEMWWKNGSMLINREGLPAKHPESIYAQLIKNGIDPSTYGIKSYSKEMEDEFKDYSRIKLIEEILDLRQQVLNMERFC